MIYAAICLGFPDSKAIFYLSALGSKIQIVPTAVAVDVAQLLTHLFLLIVQQAFAAALFEIKKGCYAITF